MSRLTKRSQKAKTDELKALKGWQQIAKFLGQPVATSQRWAKSGMPVPRQGRYVTAVPAELNRWLSRDSAAGEPVQSQSSRLISLLISNVVSHMCVRSDFLRM